MRYRLRENPEVRPGDVWRRRSASLRRTAWRTLTVLTVENGVALVRNVVTGRHSRINVAAFRVTGRRTGWALVRRGVTQ